MRALFYQQRRRRVRRLIVLRGISMMKCKVCGKHLSDEAQYLPKVRRPGSGVLETDEIGQFLNFLDLFDHFLAPGNWCLRCRTAAEPYRSSIRGSSLLVSSSYPVCIFSWC